MDTAPLRRYVSVSSLDRDPAGPADTWPLGTRPPSALARAASRSATVALVGGERGYAMIPAGIISADGHVCEPANCYVDHIDPKYRDEAPHIVTQDDGTDAFIVPGMKRPVPLGFIDGAGFGPRERLERAKTMKFSDVRLAAYRGKERLPYMDQDGIAAELIYASVGMGHLHAPRRRVQGRVHVGLQPLAGRDVRRRARPDLRHGPDRGDSASTTPSPTSSGPRTWAWSA